MKSRHETSLRAHKARVNLKSLFAICAGSIGVSIGIYLWSVQFLFSVTSISQKYGEYDWYSDNCSVAMPSENLLKTDFDALTAPLTFVRGRVPMRLEGAPVFRPKIGEMMVVRCIIDLTKLSGQPEPWITFSLVSGTSTIFINNEPVFFGRNSPYAWSFLRPHDIKNESIVTIVARRQGRQNPVGLSGNVPLMFGSGTQNLNTVLHYWQTYSVNNALVRLGVTTATLLLFFAVWIRGIRYPDVEWMLVSLTALSLFPLSQVLFASGITIPFASQFTVIYFLEAASIAGFSIAFTRSQKALTYYKWLSGSFILLGIPLYTKLDEIYRFPPLSNFRFSMYWLVFWVVTAGIMCVAMTRGMNAQRKSRLMMISGIFFIGAILYCTQLYFLFSKVILLAPFINHGLMSIFSVFVMTDLVINRNEIKLERAAKIERELELNSIRQKLDVAKSVQNALLPEMAVGTVANIHYQILYESFDVVAGDWVVKDKFMGGDIFLMGDITGKGPPAAMAMAATIGLARTVLHKAKDLDELVKDMNDGLFQLFSGAVGSTLAMVFVPQDGTLNVCCFGSPPIIVMNGPKLHAINPTGGFLGLGMPLKATWEKVPFGTGSFLTYLSDGFVGGSRDLAKYCRKFEHTDSLNNLDAIVRAIQDCRLSQSHNIADDRSGLVLRAAA